MKMKMQLTSGLLGVAALLITSQANAATVQIDPNSITVSNGVTFDLTVAGVDFPETIGGGFLLGWDTSILQLVTSQTDMEGQLAAGGWDTSSVVTSTPGVLDVLNTTFLGSFTGNFNILTLQFTALQEGFTTAALSLTDRNGSDWLSGDFFTPIAVSYVGADITVGAVPVPAAVWLFGSGLIGLVGIARRRSSVTA